MMKSNKQKITIALTGNPNSGKTTLFNALTGSRQHVGNYPGITVEKKEGFIESPEHMLHFVDLPGTYSLTAYSQEELVARNYMVREEPDLVVDVVNAASLERNLFLAVQILELGAPLILALNMMDEVRKKGMTLNTDLLAQRMGCRVVETVARLGKGKQELIETIISLNSQKQDFKAPLEISYGPDLDPVLNEMVAVIEKNSFLTDIYPARWVALKYLEQDEEIIAEGSRKHPDISERLKRASENVAEHCLKTMKTYPEAIIADYRYGFISSLLKDVVTRDEQRQRIEMSDQVDKFLTHRLLGPAFMVFVLYMVYSLTFLVGDIPLGLIEDFFGWLGNSVRAVVPDGLLQSLIISGMIDGVGAVLSFVPLLMIIFFCIAFLEDSGYMARVAYMLDRVFRYFGLHGCSIMPFIVSGGIAGGCAVPGIMAARTLRSPREKLATILTAPFMTCGAKLPVFLLLAGIFFPANQALALFMITFLAWGSALLISKLLRSTIIKGPATPFVMELPPYRLPTLQGLLIHTWERTWQYIKKAGTIILAISILIWAAMTFPQLPDEHLAGSGSEAVSVSQSQTLENGMLQENPEESLSGNRQSEFAREEQQLAYSFAGRVGSFLEPVTSWAGFDWKINISLVGGFAAKEVIISTLGTAYSLGAVDEDLSSLSGHIRQDPAWDAKRAISLIIFVLLYAPCFVAVVAIARESGSWKWAGFSMVFNTLFAFMFSTVTYQTLKLFI
ncbi:MAG: ferrous iron transport protein B [Desulfonatronovibrio sp.]